MPFAFSALSAADLDPISSTGECEYPLDNTCHKNEECYLPPHTHKRVGTCRCKKGYIRDSTNTCVATPKLIGEFAYLGIQNVFNDVLGIGYKVYENLAKRKQVLTFLHVKLRKERAAMGTIWKILFLSVLNYQYWNDIFRIKFIHLGANFRKNYHSLSSSNLQNWLGEICQGVRVRTGFVWGASGMLPPQELAEAVRNLCMCGRLLHGNQ